MSYTMQEAFTQLNDAWRDLVVALVGILAPACGARMADADRLVRIERRIHYLTALTGRKNFRVFFRSWCTVMPFSIEEGLSICEHRARRGELMPWLSKSTVDAIAEK